MTAIAPVCVYPFSSLTGFCGTMSLFIENRRKIYSIRPLQLQDKAEFKQLLAAIASARYSVKEVASVIDELVARKNLFCCYLIRDPERRLVGHLTFDRTENRSAIYVCLGLTKDHQFPFLFAGIWKWIKIFFSHVNNQEASLCVKAPPTNRFLENILKQEGFTYDPPPSEDPPKMSLYQKFYPPLERTYQIPTKQLIASAQSPPHEPLDRWKPYLPTPPPEEDDVKYSKVYNAT